MYNNFFQKKKILITGGIGFLGSNIAKKLVELGSDVTLVDSMLPDYGGNEENIASFRNQVHVSFTDIRDSHSMPYLLKDKDILFNLAGQISHMDSMNDPIADLEINSKSQISLLENCRKHNSNIKIIYASTRQIYGRTNADKPTKENHPLNPTDVNGINKLSGELYHSLYNTVYGLKTTSLRMTNTYGPRQLIKHNRQGFISWFINRSLLNDKISLYGDGQQIRDFTFIEDAVDAFLLAAQTENSAGEIYNLGGIRPYTLLEVATILKEINPKLTIEKIPFPEERKKIDIGSYVADFSKAEKELCWTPKIDLKTGLLKAIEYYIPRLDKYL